MDGFSAKFNGEVITEFPAILIGQIAKNDIHKDKITGYEVMQFCMSMLLDGQARLGGGIVTLECKNIPYLIRFYEQFGFQQLDIESGEDGLVQFMRILQSDELIGSY